MCYRNFLIVCLDPCCGNLTLLCFTYLPILRKHRINANITQFVSKNLGRLCFCLAISILRTLKFKLIIRFFHLMGQCTSNQLENVALTVGWGRLQLQTPINHHNTSFHHDICWGFLVFGKIHIYIFNGFSFFLEEGFLEWQHFLSIKILKGTLLNISF